MTKILLTLTVVLSALMVSARPVPEKRPPAPGPSGVSRHIWRAFGELSDAERKEMMQLQRENPEKFLEVMKKKAEAFFKAEKAERGRVLPSPLVISVFALALSFPSSPALFRTGRPFPRRSWCWGESRRQWWAHCRRCRRKA